MRYPEFLKENGTIGFVAPSFGCSFEPYISCFNRVLSIFENMGYKSQLGPNCYLGDGIGISTDPKSCGQELTESYISDDNDVIISCGGGELMCETISYVDFDVIGNSTPKWYMGYSDNTNFTFLLTTLCDVASLYAPCAGTFAMDPWHESLQMTWDVLTGKTLCVNSFEKYEILSLKDEEHPFSPYNLTETTCIKAYNFSMQTVEVENLEMKGRLVGGCMDCLCNLVGTRFDKVNEFVEKYKDDGIIWFLEACDLNVFSIRRAMWEMKEAGWFKYTRGFIFGRPLNGGDMFNLDHYEAVLSTVRELSVPAILDADIGHVSPMMPMICGAVGDIKFRDGKLTIDFELK